MGLNEMKEIREEIDETVVYYERLDDWLTLEQVIRGNKFIMPIKHLHDEYEIYYLIEGNRYYFINQQTYEVKKGSLVFVDRNQIHKTAAMQDENRIHERILIQVSRDTLVRLSPLFGGIDMVNFFMERFGVLELTEEEQEWAEEILKTMKMELEIAQYLTAYYARNESLEYLRLLWEYHL